MFVNFTICGMMCRKRRIKTYFRTIIQWLARLAILSKNSHQQISWRDGCMAVLISIPHIDDRWDTTKCWTVIGWSAETESQGFDMSTLETGSGTGLRLGWWLEKWRHTSGLKGLRPASLMKVLQCAVALTRRSTQLFNGSMTYAPTTNAPARNANVEAYIKPDPIPNPNPIPNPYPALNQKPNHTHESNSVFGEVSMPEQLSPEHMLCHLFNVRPKKIIVMLPSPDRP